ncbi:hypothetical protein [Streptomyces sp. NPDC003635]
MQKGPERVGGPRGVTVVLRIDVGADSTTGQSVKPSVAYTSRTG